MIENILLKILAMMVCIFCAFYFVSLFSSNEDMPLKKVTRKLGCLIPAILFVIWWIAGKFLLKP
jgi:hypothetical protein